MGTIERRARGLGTEISVPGKRTREGDGNGANGLGQADSGIINLLVPRHVSADTAALEVNRVVGTRRTKHPAQGAYRMLRTRLMRRLRANNWRSVAITAARPGEGKTLTAINLAISVAGEPDQEVILVDFDLRHPSIYRCLGIRPQIGLVDYLRDESVSLEQIVISMNVERLGMIVNDKVVDESSDLLASPRARQLMEDLDSAFPKAIKIFDLPPVLSTDDALVVAPHMDAFLFVVAEGQTTREDLQRAREVLNELNVVGTVLNKSVETDANQYYYY